VRAEAELPRPLNRLSAGRAAGLWLPRLARSVSWAPLRPRPPTRWWTAVIASHTGPAIA